MISISVPERSRQWHPGCEWSYRDGGLRGYRGKAEGEVMSEQHFWIYGAIIVLLNVLFFVVPATLIVRRTGHSGWWMLILLVPFGIVFGLWVLALGRWPALRRSSN
jgi:uncharacterized membrane protein YhaH (DUF805 family)